ncbi:phage tail protein [Serratia fonticola]|uniref:phage tail-collar fiber domain-containing protein n=1 Tax=Serratia fonticola TaxID=47917 RepID=UPI001415327F|nr:Phage tail fiber protein [Serratia fonticola]
MSKYRAILTTAGAAKIAAASAGGKPLTIDRLAVGDGNGTLPTPNPAQTKLINERYRAALNSLTVDKAAPDRLIAELIIPASVGGFWLREMGLYDADGVLIAVSNMAESYKPKLEEGSGRTQTLRMVLIVSHTEAITLIVSGDMVTATRDFVAAAIDDHAKSRNHPDATTAAKGFVQLSSVTNSTSEALAATPKAVKAVSDAAVKLAQNLADLPDKAKARASLGLKSAALCEVGTNVGQLLAADDAFGLGAGPKHRSDAYIASAEFFRTTNDSANKPSTYSAGVVSLPIDGSPTTGYLAVDSNKKVYAGVSNRTNKTVGWCQLYSTENKPSAADVDAVSASQGGEFHKEIQASRGVMVANNWQGKPGGIFPGNGDDRTFDVCNVDIKSWYGIGFYNTCTGNGIQGRTIIMNVRAGYLEAKGNIKGLGVYDNSGRVYSPGNKPTAADVGALTDTQALQKYALRSIRVNGKPLSADVNLLAGDVNAWNKTEADARYLMKTGGQLSGIVKTSSEIQSTNQNNYRIIGGSYGTFWRNDGNALYLLMTNANDQLGGYSSHRPFAVSMATGGVTLGTQMTLTDANFVNKMGFTTYTDGAGKAHRQANGLRLRVADAQLAEFYYNETVGQSAEVSLHNKYGTTDSYFSLRNDGSVTISGVSPQLNFNNGTALAIDGNVHGSVWGGYLSNFISNAVDGRVDWNSFNNRSHVAGSRQAWWYKDELTGFIFQGGVVNRGEGYLTWVGFPRGYTQDCFGVQLTLAGHWGDSNMNFEAQSLSAGGFNAAMGDNERVLFWSAVGV